MTESDWLTSTDPQAMLEYLQGQYCDEPVPGHEPVIRCRRLASNRKLRLFLETGCPRCRENTATMSLERAVAYVATADCASPAQKAALLRDIFGNPWRPVPGLQCAKYQNGVWHETADWLTWHDGIVVKLAQEAYDKRGQACPNCEGRGKIFSTKGRHSPRPCLICCGIGRIDNGTLDAGRLAVLADALEEAGCTGEAMLRHLRGWRPCRACQINPDEQNRIGCAGWEKSDAPHVRGCWMLDLLLGKE